MAQAEGVTPSQEDLLAELQALKLANPEMGAKKLQAAVKEKNPTWLVSEARVKKVAVEAGLLPAAPPVEAAAAGGAAAAPKKASKAKAQTKPEPTVPICEVYPTGDWPVGEIMEYVPTPYGARHGAMRDFVLAGTTARMAIEAPTWKRKRLSAPWASRIS